MTDNVTTNPGSGGAIFRTDEIGGVHHPLNKLEFGADGEATPVDADNPLPVDMGTVIYLLAAILDKLPRIDANDRLIVNASEISPASTPVSGTVSVSTVTSVTAVAGINSIGTNLAVVNAVPMHLANAGANYLYDRITL